MSVGKIYRCQSETYEPVFYAGDLGKVDCGGDLLSQRIQALLILSGVVRESLPAVWGKCESPKLLSNQGGG